MTRPSDEQPWEQRSDAITAAFSVPFSYEIRFTCGVFDPGNPTLRNIVADGHSRSRVVVFIDRGVADAWPMIIQDIGRYAAVHNDAMQLVCEPAVVAGGESAKEDSSVVDFVMQSIDAAKICRHSFVIAVGGGAVLDAVGFAAATAHRGVRLIRFPTTTLAQGDAGVGVKNGIDAFGKKNFIGSFAPPYAVVNDERFLTSLSNRDWRAGIAEVVKVALLKDASLFGDVERVASQLNRCDRDALLPILRRSSELHVAHIANGADPFERKSSRPLDFGHWAAHKIEESSGFRIRHGEAVAIGVALDSVISVIEGRMPQSEMHRVLKCLVDIGLPVYHMLLEDTDRLADGVEQFRQHLGGRLALTQLAGIGKPIEVNSIDMESVKEAVKRLAAYLPGRIDLFRDNDADNELQVERSTKGDSVP